MPNVKHNSTHRYAVAARLKGGDVGLCVCICVFVCVQREDLNRLWLDKDMGVNLIEL